MKALLLAFTLLVSQAALALTNDIDNLNWHLKKEIDGIKVLSAEVPESPFQAYLAITVIEANTTELMKIIRNPATCSDWAYRCGESYRYDQESPNVDLVYTSSKMPFPVMDRDTLARITWEQDPETRVIKATGTATNNILAPKDKHVRIVNATVIWELTPLADDKTLVRTYGHADPGGELPTWLTNQMSTEVPVKSLNGLKTLAADLQSEPSNESGFKVTGF